MTMDELCDKLMEQYDVELLLELLQINAEELLDRFEDRIEAHWDRLQEAVEDE